MSDQTTEQRRPSEPNGTAFDCGGLRFEASFRAPSGATLRVSGDVGGQPTELLRFDDFIDQPHYHLPGAGPSIAFDRETLGEPLDWIVRQLRDHLGALLTDAGFAEILPAVDQQAITDNAERIRQAMENCVPEGYVRVPGIGLQLAAV
jgi:hypothetical protein